MSDAPQLVEGVDVDALASAIQARPSVARLGGKGPGAMATYLPGHHVPGLRVSADRISIAVAVRWPVPVADVVSDVRRVVADFAPGRSVDVNIADIELPDANATARK